MIYHKYLTFCVFSFTPSSIRPFWMRELHEVLLFRGKISNGANVRETDKQTQEMKGVFQWPVYQEAVLHCFRRIS